MEKIKYIVIFFLFILITCTVFSARENLTFVIWSDSHFGAYDYADTTRLNIMEQINALSAVTVPPGFSDRPEGLLPDILMHCGDITETGAAGQWSDPNAPDQRSYLQTLKHLNPKIKPYAVLGNHDSRKAENIRDSFAALYYGTYYSFDCKGVHFAALDPYPEMNSAAPSLDGAQLDWLRDDLAAVGPNTPVIIVMHILPIFDETIDRTSRLDRESSEALAAIIDDHNILAFLHGHWHTQSVKEWNGIPVIAPAGFAYYRDGCKNGHPVLGVAQVTDAGFAVYSYNWESRTYESAPLYQKQFSAK